jgi:hypothetical protein
VRDALLILFTVVIAALVFAIVITTLQGGPETCTRVATHALVCRTHPVWYVPPAPRRAAS